MSKRFRLVLPVLVTALAGAAIAPAPSVAASPAALHAKTQQARFGSRGFGARPSYRPRTRSPYGRSYRRPSLTRGLFGGILKALGVAYLFHMLFGWGAGGSPVGLLLLVGLVFWLAMRRPRRRAYY